MPTYGRIRTNKRLVLLPESIFQREIKPRAERGMKPAGKENQMEKTNTCSYIRTSTDREEQEGSFETQKAYFEDLITSDPELEYVGCYGDFGKSGRFADKRPEFQRMLKDCEEGKIQLIYTKSVSRFARSVADFVETVTLLRGLGVLVYFDEENLNTEYRNMELLLHILAIMAAEESRIFLMDFLIA